MSIADDKGEAVVSAVEELVSRGAVPQPRPQGDGQYRILPLPTSLQHRSLVPYHFAASSLSSADHRTGRLDLENRKERMVAGRVGMVTLMESCDTFLDLYRKIHDANEESDSAREYSGHALCLHDQDTFLILKKKASQKLLRCPKHSYASGNPVKNVRKRV